MVYLDKSNNSYRCDFCKGRGPCSNASSASSEKNIAFHEKFECPNNPKVKCTECNAIGHPHSRCPTVLERRRQEEIAREKAMAAARAEKEKQAAVASAVAVSAGELEKAKASAKAGADVFDQQWFQQWVYGVLQTLKDIGRKKPTSVTVVGVKPDLNQNFITKVEFPELMERIRAAFAGAKVGFEYSFCSFLECDTHMLSRHLKTLEAGDYIVIASSPNTKMKEVEEMTRLAPNVRIAWAEANDFSNEAAGV